MTNLLFLIIGVVLGFFLNYKQLSEKTKRTQEKINKQVQKIKKKKNKLDIITFKNSDNE